MLVDAAVRDGGLRDGPAGLGALVRIRGATKTAVGAIGEPVEVGRCVIHAGDAVVLDADGAAVVASSRIGEVLEAALARAGKERDKRAALETGALSYDLDGLRALVESP